MVMASAGMGGLVAWAWPCSEGRVTSAMRWLRLREAPAGRSMEEQTPPSPPRTHAAGTRAVHVDAVRGSEQATTNSGRNGGG